VIFSISASWSSSRAASKMPPQLGGPPIQVVIAPEQVIEIHGVSLREVQPER